MKTIILLVLLLPLASQADDFCKRQAEIDPEYPAGLAGTYDLIGRIPGTNKTYSGKLEIGYGEQAYTLVRSIGKSKVAGEAWIEFCSPDRIVHLIMKYKPSPKPLELFCSLGGDGNNYFRITCLSKYVGASSKEVGHEALFQRH